MLKGAHRSQEGEREGGGDLYLSAPGREAATFGRGGGAGGLKLKDRAKTKGQQNHMTRMNMELFNININMDKKIQYWGKLGEEEHVDCEIYLNRGRLMR